MVYKILYVEDEEFLGRIVKETLASQGFEVLLIDDGANVMKVYVEYQPDVCVLDIMLPNIDGLSLGKQIRTLDAHMPIIYLTAKTTEEDLLKGFESGGTDYVKKPFSVKELIARIHNQLKLLQKSGNINESENDEIYLGLIRFSPRRYELNSGDYFVKLSARESQVLNILVAHKNKITERSLLLKSVWGDDSYFNSRNLDVYIRKLREHLSYDKRIEILTLKGVGYQFIVP